MVETWRAELFVAARFLRGVRERSRLSVSAGFSLAGIAAGVAALILVLAVMTGMGENLLRRIVGAAAHIAVEAGPRGLADYEPLAARLRGIPGVQAVTPVAERQVMASLGRRARIARVKGIRASDLLARPGIAAGLKKGSLGDFGGGAILLGDGLARALGVGVGGRLTLTTPRAGERRGIAPAVVRYRVAGIFEVGAERIDNGMIYLPLAAAQRFFGLDGRVSALEVMVDQPLELAAVRQRVAAVVAGRSRIVDWQQANRQLFVALQVERLIMFAILGLVVLVAAFNIVTGSVVLVKRQARGIAILRTMGAPRASVLRIFIANGALIGVAGTAIGLALGLGLAFNIEALGALARDSLGDGRIGGVAAFLTSLPAVVRGSDIAAVVAISLGLTLLATLYPAWRAARLDPVEALRYE